MEAQIISLYELNNFIRGTLNDTFSQCLWIRAEMSDVRVNQNGHCYLEFIEKDENNRNIIAKARGSIWSNVFKLLKAYFESETGQPFTSGLKVLVQVSVEFHELYGFSLNVHNIDPTYTLGDQARKRAEIIRQLEEDGVLDLNRELELTAITNRIAIISSPTAAGYEDFCNQLENNADGFVFYTHLFPAVMQGDRTEDSVISALERIYDNVTCFDAVVIIRGGGATSELNSFDSYLLAASCAQFPLPIITGIGHERDDTVLDIVAHTRMKTPTAVADFLVKKMQGVASDLFDLQETLMDVAEELITDNKKSLDSHFTRFSYITRDMTKDRLNLLSAIQQKLEHSAKKKLIKYSTSLEILSKRLPYATKDKTKDKYIQLTNLSDRLKVATQTLLQEKKYELENKEQFLQLLSPENILKKGYTLTLKDNKIVKNAHQIKQGDKLVTRFHDGDIRVEAE